MKPGSIMPMNSVQLSNRAHVSPRPDRSPWQRVVQCTGYLVAIVMFMFAGSYAWGQNPNSQSDPAAIAIVTKSLIALGGVTNWQSIGAATATVSISRSVGPVETAQLSHDWHLGYLLSRGEYSDSKGRTASVITQRDQQLRAVGNGAAHTVPRENDIAVLAKVYPGAALAISLNQSACAFRLASANGLKSAASGTGTSDETIEEDCRDPFLPITARLTWTFSKSNGLPVRVEIPIRDVLHNAVLNETVTFTQFSRQGSVLVPSQVEITLPSGQTETRSIAQWSFTTALPASTFTSIP